MASLISDDDGRRIREDAWEAIDSLQAVMKETGKEFCFAYYIREKAEKARLCVDFILSIATAYQEGEK